MFRRVIHTFVLAAYSLYTITLCISLTAHTPSSPSRSIRVRLSDLVSQKVQKKYSFTLTNSGTDSITVRSPKQKLSLKGHTLTITVTDDAFILRGSQTTQYRCTAPSITICSTSHPHTLQGEAGKGTYEGTFTITRRNNQPPMVINTLPLESYLYAVLPYEIFPSWPTDMQKVQAIVSRTYALYNSLRARARGKAYDVSNTNFHQSYRGYHNFTHLRAAIADTAGTIIVSKSQPILAMFDACCGGLVPAEVSSNLTHYPYLARPYACNFCTACSLSTWRRTLNLNEFVNTLKKESGVHHKIAALSPPFTIAIHNQDRAGMVSEVRLSGKTKHCNLPMKLLMRHAGVRLWSSRITFEPIADTSSSVIVMGRGFGHCFGLCQNGAHELVKRGWSTRQIIAYYYPHTSLYTMHHARV